MGYITFAHSSWGPKYQTKGFACQDYSDKRNLGDIQIIAVADGHGSNDCFRSNIGSELAVKTAFDMISEYEVEGCFNLNDDGQQYLDSVNAEMKGLSVIEDGSECQEHSLYGIKATSIDYDSWLQKRQNVYSAMSDKIKNENSDNLKAEMEAKVPQSGDPESNKGLVKFNEDGIKSFKYQFWKRWRAAVQKDWDSKLNKYIEECEYDYGKDYKPEELNDVIERHESRFQKVSDKYRDRYSKKEEADRYLYTAYGTTFLLALAIKSQILLLQIGDGTCVLMQRNGTFSVPVPADEDNFLNVTVSLCEEDAYKKIRHVVLDNVVSELAPVAVFLSSDGLDDCYPVYHNDKYLYRLYYEILRQLSADSSAKALDELNKEIKDSLLPNMTSQGSQDDISLAFLVNSDINALKEALSCVNPNDINPDYEDESEQNRKTDDEPESKNLTTECQSVSKSPKLEVPANGMFLAAEDSRRKKSYKEAFEAYQEASSRKNIFAYYWLAWFYENGRVGKVDPAQAEEYYRKAFEGLEGISVEAVNGLSNGRLRSYIQYILGWYYEKKDERDKAKDCYKSASELGYEEAQYRLGCLGLEDNQIEEAKRWLGKAAQQGHVEANYELGKSYKDDNYEKAKQYLKNAAVNGHLDAKYELYLLCKKHNEISNETKRFLYEVADQGNLSAQLEAINCYSNDYEDYRRNINYYENSIKCSKDIPDLAKYRAQFKLGSLCYNLGKYSEAEDLLRKAAKSDKPQVRWKLYRLLCDVEKCGEADLLLKKLADDGEPEALYKLGEQAYENENIEEARRRFTKAADKGDIESQYRLGCIYDDEGNNIDAKKWFKKAAERGHAKAQYELSCILYKESSNECQKWLEKSANNGYSEAQYTFGLILLKKDRKKAEEYFTKAVKQGHVEANYELGKIYCDSGYMQDSVRCFNQAAKGGCIKAWCGLGDVYYRCRKFYDAEKCYRQAFCNGDIEALSKLTLCIEKQRHNDKANIYRATSLLAAGKLEEFFKLKEKFGSNAYSRSEDLDKISKEVNSGNCQEILRDAMEYLLDPFSFNISDIRFIFDKISKAVKEIGKLGCEGWEQAADKLKVAASRQLQSTTNANYTVQRKVNSQVVSQINTYENEGDYYFRLGEEYYYGRNGKNYDYKRAVDCYRYAAERNHIKAMRKLAYCYKRGIGMIEKDVKQAEALEDRANALEQYQY